MNDAELARLRTTDLIAVAQAWGYSIDPRESCPSSSVLRRGDEKIIVTTKATGQVYCSVHDPADSGAVIEFCQRRLSAAGQPSTIGHVRKWLREFAGESADHPQERALGKKIEPAVPSVPPYDCWRDLAAATLPHPYLSQRGIPDDVQSDPRWASRIKVDQRGNLCFAHFDLDRHICGWETKNVGWAGFSGGGRKGLFCAGITPETTEIVVCESAIDALSHATLHPDPSRGYISVAGQVSSYQLDTLALAIGDRMAIIATDADDAGDNLAARITAVVRKSERHRPEQKDWNDVLRVEAEAEGVRI